MCFYFYFAEKNDCDLDPCAMNTICEITANSFICICNEGYSGDGFNSCESQLIVVIIHSLKVLSFSDVNECDSNPCAINAVCVDTNGSFSCSCSNGYIGDGLICEGKLANGLCLLLF